MPALVPDALSLTLGEILGLVAEKFPDSPALLSAERCLTWDQLDQEVDRCAGLLLGAGLGPGAVLGCVSNKHPEVITAFLACARIGALFAPVNFKLMPEQIRDQFALSRIRHVLTDGSFEAVISDLRPMLAERGVITLGSVGGPQDLAYSQISEHPARRPEHRPGPQDPCYLNVTSGTTGRPKSAVASHLNIVANALSGVEGFGFSREDTFYGLFSVFSHPHELFHRSLLVGGAFVILDTMSPRVVCEAVERWRVAWMMAVPSFYAMMLDYGGQTRHDLSSLRVLEAGGAWVGAETLKEMESQYRASFMPVWGSTETTGVGLAMPANQPRCPGATGKVAPYYEIRVIDDQGQELPDGEEGEMLVRGPGVVSGYLGMPEESRAAFQDGWYHTQDRVRRDKDGFVHFIGRLSDMIKVGGIRVYPLEIEKVLAEHPDVGDVIVVRAEERLRGEVPRAIVCLVPGSTLTPEKLKAWARDRLPVYKQPRILEIWEEIPKLPNGKIDRRAVALSPLRPVRAGVKP